MNGIEGGPEMKLDMGGPEKARKWLTSEHWLTFDFGNGNFATFLENNYFEPGTAKNAEFETMILPEEGGVSLWYRIKDTHENRENLRKAMSEFYGPIASDIDAEIEEIQEKVRRKAEDVLEGGEME